MSRGCARLTNTLVKFLRIGFREFLSTKTFERSTRKQSKPLTLFRAVLRAKAFLSQASRQAWSTKSRNCFLTTSVSSTALRSEVYLEPFGRMFPECSQ